MSWKSYLCSCILALGCFFVEKLRSGIFARMAVVLFLIACGIALSANHVWMLFIAVFISGTGNALYWSPVQNAVGREAGAKKDSAAARFSVFHALGKSIGYVLGGLLKGSLGATISFIADMVFSGTQLIFVPLGISTSSSSSSSPNKYHIMDDKHDTSESVLHSVDDITPSETPEVIISDPHHADSDVALLSQKQPKQLETPSLSPVSLPSPGVEQTPSPSSSPSLPSEHVGLTPSPSEARDFARNTVFLYLSWIMNFGAYGSMTVVSNQYIKLIVKEDIGFGSPSTPSSSSPSFLNSSMSSISSNGGQASSRNELFLGAFLCLVYLAQMTMFLVGFISNRWMYHRWFIYIMELIGCTCLALISVVHHPVALLFIAFGCGLMAGTGYLSSYTYSFHSKGKSGKLVSLQETVLSMSSVILPPLAGFFVSTFDEVRVPYWMCSILIVLIFITQEITYQVFWHRWNAKNAIKEESVELSSKN